VRLQVEQPLHLLARTAQEVALPQVLKASVSAITQNRPRPIGLKPAT
jgi:hypothetical protein